MVVELDLSGGRDVTFSIAATPKDDVWKLVCLAYAFGFESCEHSAAAHADTRGLDHSERGVRFLQEVATWTPDEFDERGALRDRFELWWSENAEREA